MFNSLISSTLYMKMDIYESTLTQDEITKALKRQWLYKKTAQCLARGYVSETSKTSGSGEKVGERYQDMDYLTIETEERLVKSQRITNIRNQKDEVIWFDLIQNNYDTPVIYEVQGVIPVLDPFGSILSYNVTVKKSEVQSLEG